MVRFLKLPSIPVDIIDRLPKNFDQFRLEGEYANGAYSWSHDHNNEINDWCRQNICENMYWGFQIMRGDVPRHKNIGTETKLIYLIQASGDKVETNFWADDKITLTHSYIIPVNSWHVLRAKAYHSVDGVEPGQIRFSLTGRIFPE
jgi:hypothetical protein